VEDFVATLVGLRLDQTTLQNELRLGVSPGRSQQVRQAISNIEREKKHLKEEAKKIFGVKLGKELNRRVNELAQTLIDCRAREKSLHQFNASLPKSDARRDAVKDELLEIRVIKQGLKDEAERLYNIKLSHHTTTFFQSP